MGPPGGRGSQDAAPHKNTQAEACATLSQMVAQTLVCDLLLIP